VRRLTRVLASCWHLVINRGYQLKPPNANRTRKRRKNEPHAFPIHNAHPTQISASVKRSAQRNSRPSSNVAFNMRSRAMYLQCLDAMHGVNWKESGHWAPE
jgi:hypothetical protein